MLTVIPPQKPSLVPFPWALCCCPCSHAAPEPSASAEARSPPSAPGKPIRFPTRSDVPLLLRQDPGEAGNKLLIFPPEGRFRRH